MKHTMSTMIKELLDVRSFYPNMRRDHEWEQVVSNGRYYGDAYSHLNTLGKQKEVTMRYESKSWIHQWKMWGYNQLPTPMGINVPVYDFNNHMKNTDIRTIFGPATRLKEPKIVRFRIDYPETQDDLITRINKVIALIQKKRPDMNPVPSHDGWMNISEESVIVDILFANIDYNEKSQNYSRYQLWYHLCERSKSLGIHKAAVVKDGSIALHDGQFYVKEDTFGPIPWTIIKCIGYKDYTNFVYNQELTCKGMAHILPAWEFNKLISEYDLDEDVKIIIPEITPKFYKGEKYVNLEMYSVFDTIISDKVSISWQGATRTPLTYFGNRVLESTWSERINEIQEAMVERTGKKMFSVIDKVYSEIIENDIDLKDIDSRDMDRLESLSASMKELMFLPARADETLNKFLGIALEKRLKKIKMAGITAIAAADSNLKYNEVIIPRNLARKHGIDNGDMVTSMRSPHTGLEWADCKVVGFTENPCVYINPTFWADRFSGDFDGDLIGILPVGGIVNESCIAGKVSSKSKGKKALTVGEAIGKSFYSKLSIGRIDLLIYAAIEAGKDFTPVREALQAVIDNIKHDVEIPSVDYLCESMGIDLSMMPPIYKLIRGKIGNHERANMIRYNILVDEIKDNRSNIKWIRNIESKFHHVFCKTKFLNTYDLSQEDMEAYINMVRKYDHIEYASKDNFMPGKFNRNMVNKNRNIAESLKKRYESDINIVRLAEKIHTSYDKYVSMLRTAGKQSNYDADYTREEAYEIIRRMNKYLQENPEISGKAIKYLFLCTTHRFGTGKLNDKNLIKNYKIFSYLPLVVGEWDLSRAVKFYGGKPEMDYSVISEDTPERKMVAIQYPSRDSRKTVQKLRKLYDLYGKSMIIVTSDKKFMNYLKSKGVSYIDASGVKDKTVFKGIEIH